MLIKISTVVTENTGASLTVDEKLTDAVRKYPILYGKSLKDSSDIKDN